MRLCSLVKSPVSTDTRQLPIQWETYWQQASVYISVLNEHHICGLNANSVCTYVAVSVHTPTKCVYTHLQDVFTHTYKITQTNIPVYWNLNDHIKLSISSNNNSFDCSMYVIFLTCLFQFMNSQWTNTTTTTTTTTTVVMQSHTLHTVHQTCFGQYQASSAALGWVEDAISCTDAVRRWMALSKRLVETPLALWHAYSWYGLHIVAWDLLVYVCDHEMTPKYACLTHMHEN